MSPDYEQRYRETLGAMAECLDELDVMDATPSENVVCGLLVNNGFMEVVGFDDSLTECPVERAAFCEYRVKNTGESD